MRSKDQQQVLQAFLQGQSDEAIAQSLYNSNSSPNWRTTGIGNDSVAFFVSALTPDDRCHLNGIAVFKGKPKYVSAFSRTDIAQGWRDRAESEWSEPPHTLVMPLLKLNSAKLGTRALSDGATK
ncbi:MAG: DUF4915 domain-containing protein [Cyanothece sp. SIO2G6]|nr:DUF4915 domain-containing protein [Cyanothece sp. SIO2G6]